MPSKRCEHCGSKLFEVIPFKTTQQAMVEFARQSALPNKEVIIAHKSMHPGCYCPNGCIISFAEYRIDLPEITTDEAIAIGQRYSQDHHREFVEIHGAASRIVACVHCTNFKGAVVEGWFDTHPYKDPRLRPLCNCRIVSASCSIPDIQQLESAWWYDKGNSQPECSFFQCDDRLFIYTYKSVTGWSEYPEQ